MSQLKCIAALLFAMLVAMQASADDHKVLIRVKDCVVSAGKLNVNINDGDKSFWALKSRASKGDSAIVQFDNNKTPCKEGSSYSLTDQQSSGFCTIPMDSSLAGGPPYTYTVTVTRADGSTCKNLGDPSVVVQNGRKGH